NSPAPVGRDVRLRLLWKWVYAPRMIIRRSGMEFMRHVVKSGAAGVNPSATKTRHCPVMAHPEFDATITLNDHHLATAGLSGPKAAAAVRHAVEQMPGAG